MRAFALLLTLTYLAACADGQGTSSRQIIRQGGETIFLENGVCFLTYETGDEEHTTRIPLENCLQ